MTALEDREAPIQAPLTLERPLWQRRPDWLSALIKTDYIDARQLVPRDAYSFHGLDDEYMFRYRVGWPLEYQTVTSGDILEEVAAPRADEPTSVLDVGCGAGAFVGRCIAAGYDAQGLSACDYRQFREFASVGTLDDSAYVLGDAHGLDTVNGLMDEYDLVVSRWCLSNMRDPLSALEQMAGRLGVGGILAVDEFWTSDPGTEPLQDAFTTRDVADGLLAGGFEYMTPEIADLTERCIDDPQNDAMTPSLIMRRTGAVPLRFAAGYPAWPPEETGDSFVSYIRAISG